MSTSTLSGCVKWFNSRHKYGFITVSSEGEYKNVDLFVHQSNIITKEPCYRFLITGENVNFDVKITTDDKHPVQAVNITDSNGGSLKCELPRQQSNQSNDYNSPNTGGIGGRVGFGFGRGGFGRGNARVNSTDNGNCNGNGNENGNGNSNGFSGRGGPRDGPPRGGPRDGPRDGPRGGPRDGPPRGGGGGYRGRGGNNSGEFGRSRFGVQDRKTAPETAPVVTTNSA